MPSPFPGMDPYLEHPAVWPSVHAAMIAVMGRRLNRMPIFDRELPSGR